VRFEELLTKPIEEMTDEEVGAIADGMQLDQLKGLEKRIRKVGVKKKRAEKKYTKARDTIDSLIAEGLSS